MKFLRELVKRGGGPKSEGAKKILAHRGEGANLSILETIGILQAEIATAAPDRIEALKTELEGMSNLEKLNVLFFEKGRAVGMKMSGFETPRLYSASPSMPTPTPQVAPLPAPAANASNSIPDQYAAIREKLNKLRNAKDAESLKEKAKLAQQCRELRDKHTFLLFDKTQPKAKQ